MRLLIPITYIFLSMSCFAQQAIDILQQDENLSFKYQKGRFLVYDCLDKNWVCTKSIEYERCKKIRNKAILDQDENFPCAYFEPYQTMDECHKKQTSLTNRSDVMVFCTKTKKLSF